MARSDPHSFTDPAQGRITLLELDLQVDFECRRLHGEATLTVARDGGPLDLDTRALDVEAVTVGGAPVAWALDAGAEFVGSRLRIALPDGADRVTIRYATAPDATALHWLDPGQTAGGVHPYLFSQCQAIHARSIVPLQDSPGVRFPYRARLTVPDPLGAVMSAAPGRREPAGDGRSRFHFDMPQPVPSYLIALAVGDIDARDVGPRSRVYAEPSVVEAAAWEFADVDRMLRAAEELFGPYPWDRYDFIVMPPSFPYGGMENPRLTFLTPTMLAGDRSLVNVLAHELAHSWTGNLVTNASMNHFWLNEGFTVWAERRITEVLEGPEAVALEAAMGRQDLEDELERLGPGSALGHLEWQLEGIDPDEAFSLVPYEKGYLFLSLLERTAGREAFDRFVRRYIDTYRFTSIVTRQFEELLEDELPGLLERVDAESWIRGPGIPASAPATPAVRLDELVASARAWSDGADEPTAERAGRWSAAEWQVWLRSLPRPMSTAACDRLDTTFRLSDSRNAEVLCQWLLIVVASAYEPAMPRVREFLASTGRMKYLKPLYRSLGRRPETRATALEVFEAHADGYHPIARAGLKAMLDG